MGSVRAGVGEGTGGRSDSAPRRRWPHSCGTAPESHRTFPVTSGGWAPPEPA